MTDMNCAKSDSESIYKTFKRDNKSITIWLSLTTFNLQCGFRDETVKLDQTSRHVQTVQLPDSKLKKAKTYSSEKRARGVCQPKHEGAF